MTVQTVVDMARSGELKNIAIKSDTDAILNYINLGMIELFKRFPIKVEEYVIALQEDVDVYTLPNDCMWITAAYGEVDEGSINAVNILPINEEDNPLSINSVSWNQVQVPMSVAGSFVSIIYAAAPATIDSGMLAEHIELPPQLVEALLHYVGYRAHGSIDGNINTENTTHYTRFEASCDRVIKMGMFTGDDTSMNGRIFDKGFA